jgi:drug/metabolite transporter (DMT)-like permease
MAMKAPSTTLQAILLMLVSMGFFSAMNIVIRLASQEMHSTFIVLLRNICSLALIVLWEMARRRSLPRFATDRPMGHFWRASFGIVAMELWFHAISLLPVTLATALSFTTPIFSTICAILFLGERAGIRRWSAIFIGLIGMLIILRPGVGGIGPDALFVIGSSCMMAVAAVLVKTLTRTESPETIVFYMALFMIPWAVIPASTHLQPVTIYQLWLVLLIAFFSTTAHLLLARAYMRADMVVLMPFDFSRLVFTALMSYVIFGETLDSPTVCGSLVIVASTVYIAHREAKLKARKALDVLKEGGPV